MLNVITVNPKEPTHTCEGCKTRFPQSLMYKWSHKGDSTTPVCLKCWNELKGIPSDYGLTETQFNSLKLGIYRVARRNTSPRV